MGDRVLKMIPTNYNVNSSKRIYLLLEGLREYLNFPIEDNKLNNKFNKKIENFQKDLEKFLLSSGFVINKKSIKKRIKLIKPFAVNIEEY